MNRDKNDFLRVAKRQKTFATQARNDANNNAKAAKKAHGANKKDLEWEVKEDRYFAQIRDKKAKIAKSKAKM